MSNSSAMLAASAAIDVGDGDHGRFGNPRRQIADVDLAEPAQAEFNVTPTFNFVRLFAVI